MYLILKSTEQSCIRKGLFDRSNQRILEDNILKLNHKSFTQVVILGSSTFVPFMQLSSGHRREVIEDLLDIKIFSAMNGLVKEKIKVFREKTKILDVKKESYLDKIKMQKNFIDELENRGKENIKLKEDAIQKLLNEENTRSENDGVQIKVNSLQTELENYSGASDKLRKLGNLKGKISQKVSTITKEHKFFNDHTVYPHATKT